MCPRGMQRNIRAANLEFYSDRGISFVKQGRNSESQLFPALCPMFPPTSLPCFIPLSSSSSSLFPLRFDVHAIRIPAAAAGHRQNSIFANYSATFSHLPLFQMGHIVSQNIMNYFAQRSHTHTHSRARPAPSSRTSRASPGRCIRRFIQRGTTN